MVDGQPTLDLLGEDRSVSRSRGARVLAVAIGVLAAGLAGCSSADPPATRATTAAPTVAATPSPPPPPRRACYDLELAAASEPTNSAAPVPCAGRHTATTIHVGTVDPVVDGHLLAVDADRVQQQIAARCRARMDAVVGGTEEVRRLSRLTVVWFSPSLADSDRGARWFRCDVVALAGRDRLAALPRSVRGLLDAADALDRFGTCGTTSPAAERFQRVICSQKHTWRAQASVDLPAGANHLGKAAGAAADSACRDIATQLAGDSLRLQWSFEWPTRPQWDSGQRYGYCWTPDPG